MLKRVCIIRHGWYPADARVRKEAQALAGKGCRVDVICLRKPDQDRRSTVDGVEVYRIPLNHRRAGKIRYMMEYALSFLMIAFLLPWLFLRKRYDVIQVNTMPDFLVFTTLLPKLFGAKIVLDMHEAMPELFRSKFGFGKKHPVYRFLETVERLATSYADSVLAVGETILSLYESRGLDRSNVTIIPNSPDDYLFNYKRFDGREKKENGRFTVVSHGTLEKRYGLQVLVRAIPHIRKDIPDIQALIIGEGEYGESLKELTARTGVEESITFTGLVPFEQIPEMLFESDIGIVPIIKDDFTDIMAPNKLFEYVAMKIPVIAPDIRGIRDFFSDASVMYFRSDDEKDLARCIVDLRKDPARREALVRNATEEFREARWDVVKERYCDVFLSL